MSLPVAKVYHVPSDSNPNKRWEVLKRTDGSLSCSCPVWVFNKRKTEPRSCKHTEQVKSGLIEPTTVYQETTREDAIDRFLARFNVPPHPIRRNRPGLKVFPIANSPEEGSKVNARKLAAIKERLNKDGNMDVFPTKRKVNW